MHILKRRGGETYPQPRGTPTPPSGSSLRTVEVDLVAPLDDVPDQTWASATYDLSGIVQAGETLLAALQVSLLTSGGDCAFGDFRRPSANVGVVEFFNDSGAPMDLLSAVYRLTILEAPV